MRKFYLEVNNQIKLRLPSPEYSSTLFNLIDSQRAYLNTWMPWVSSVENEAYIQKVIKQDIRFNIGGQKLTTYIFVDDEIVGSVGLIKIDKEHKKAEMGYWLSQSHQGKGIITASVRRLISYVFNTMEINRIFLSIPAHNKASLRLPQRLNFIHEGTLRQDAIINGRICDMEIFAILKKDEKKSKSE